MNFNWYLDPIQNHYADFQGRTSRRAFWMFTLFNVIISVVLNVIDQLVLDGFTLLSGLYGLALLLPSLGIGVRRLHDIDKSGWWILIGFIPIVGWIILIYWYAQPGNPSPNEWGPPPVDPAAQQSYA
jgi:uncharacterized membrane protein YhaH (DUF805 family)